jgi:hypothetical protein
MGGDPKDQFEAMVTNFAQHSPKAHFPKLLPPSPPGGLRGLARSVAHGTCRFIERPCVKSSDSIPHQVSSR